MLKGLSELLLKVPIHKAGLRIKIFNLTCLSWLFSFCTALSALISVLFIPVNVVWKKLKRTKTYMMHMPTRYKKGGAEHSKKTKQYFKLNATAMEVESHSSTTE